MRYERFASLLVLTGLLVMTAACGSGGGMSSTVPPTPIPPGSVTSPTNSPIVLVVLENQPYSVMANSPSMPYLNGLATKYSIANNYFADTHPSIGNYFMLTTGQIVTNDDTFSGTVSVDNIVREMIASNKTWRVYAESIPSTGYLGGDVQPYVKRHNPFAYFTDVVNSPAQAANIVPLSQLTADLSATTLPDFMYILPNDFNNMHDCPINTTTCTDAQKLQAADDWLKGNIDPVLNSKGMQNKGVVVITVDESLKTDTANGGGQVMTVVAGPGAKAAFHSSTLFQHESTLRLICDRLKLSVCPGAGSSAVSLGELTQ